MAAPNAATRPRPGCPAFKYVYPLKRGPRLPGPRAPARSAVPLPALADLAAQLQETWVEVSLFGPRPAPNGDGPTVIERMEAQQQLAAYCSGTGPPHPGILGHTV